MARSVNTQLKRFFSKALAETKRFASEWMDSNAGTYGSSVAYYVIFALAPVLVIAISIMSFFVSTSSAQASIIRECTAVFGQTGADFVNSLIQANVSASTSIVTTIIGAVILFIGATGVFSQLQSALDRIFVSLPVKEKEGFWTTIWRKLISFGMVLSVGFVLLVSLALSAIVTFLTGPITSITTHAGILLRLFEYAVSFGLISFFLALMYKILPSHRIKWKPALVGGVIAGVLFTVSKYFLGLYLGSPSLFTSYGTASALVVLVLWAYYMAEVFFFAAIITRLYIVPELR